MIKKFLTIFILSIAIIAVVSGCKKKPANQADQSGNIPDINNQSNYATTSEEQAPPEEIIKYLENGEVDTSDWKTYRNEEYGFKIMHPKEWTIIKLSNSKAGYVLKSEAYEPLIDGYVVHEGEIYINKISNESNLEIINLIKTFDDTSQFWPEKYGYNEIIINENQAIIFDRIKEGKYSRKVVFIKRKNDVLVFDYLYDVKNTVTEKLFDQIVENIEFFE